MLLKSSLILLLLANFYFDNFEGIAGIFVISFLLNLIFTKTLFKSIKKMKSLFIIYIFTSIAQIFYIQEGEVLCKIFGIYITKEGAFNFLTNFLRILNLLLLSWYVNSLNIFHGKFGKYQRVVDQVVEMVPEVLSLFKKRMKLKWFFRHILKQIKVKI
jgi:hypothetical protein